MNINTVITKHIYQDKSILTISMSPDYHFIPTHKEVQLPLAYNGEVVSFKLKYCQIIEDELYVIYQYE